jgi:serine O-acetyltransferase
MDRKEMNECLECEILAPYRESKKRLNIIDKIWVKHISPESNAIYLIRRKQYMEGKGRFGRVLSRLYHAKLMRRYGIHITEGTKIGKGLRIAHPTSIVVTLCEIGENFTVYQNCTIGQKKWKSGRFPTIGNNVTMYAHSGIIGDVKVTDNVTLGAGAILLHDAMESGNYCGIPDKRIDK